MMKKEGEVVAEAFTTGEAVLEKGLVENVIERGTDVVIVIYIGAKEFVTEEKAGVVIVIGTMIGYGTVMTQMAETDDEKAAQPQQAPQHYGRSSVP